MKVSDMPGKESCLLFQMQALHNAHPENLGPFPSGLRSKYEASVAEGVALQAICKCRKNKEYFPLDSPAKGIQGTLGEVGAHQSLHSHVRAHSSTGMRKMHFGAKILAVCLLEA